MQSRLKNYITGAASIFSIAPPSSPPKVHGNFHRDDVEAIQYDWINVGNEIKKSMDAHAKKNN